MDFTGDMFKGLFKYELFNKMQSKALPVVSTLSPIFPMHVRAALDQYGPRFTSATITSSLQLRPEQARRPSLRLAWFAFSRTRTAKSPKSSTSHRQSRSARNESPIGRPSSAQSWTTSPIKNLLWSSRATPATLPTRFASMRESCPFGFRFDVCIHGHAADA